MDTTDLNNNDTSLCTTHPFTPSKHGTVTVK